jgi:hypothetical protein
MKIPDAATEVREEFGFRRNVCACRKCSLWCEHVPGALVPSDLERLIPDGDDPFQWAEVHLRASPGFEIRNEHGEIILKIPSLVPKRQQNGHCHWLQSGLCSIHADSPFGCAFLSQCQQTKKQAESRNIAARLAREKAFQEGHLYAQIWTHLWNANLRELTTQKNIKCGVQAMRKLDDAEKRREVNAQKKANKKRKKKQRR